MTIARSRSSGSIDVVVLIVGMIGWLVIFAICGLGFLEYREAAWPWTDRAPEFGWFHCVNETDMPVAWAWRSHSLDGWNYVGSHWCEGGPEPDSWQAAGEVDAILAAYSGAVIEVRIQFPAERGLPPVVTSFVLTPGLHVRLRVASDHRAYLALGSATDIGYATFGPQRQIGDS